MGRNWDAILKNAGGEGNTSPSSLPSKSKRDWNKILPIEHKVSTLDHDGHNRFTPEEIKQFTSQKSTPMDNIKAKIMKDTVPQTKVSDVRDKSYSYDTISNKVAGTTLDLLGRPANATINAIKESGAFKQPHEITNKLGQKFIVPASDKRSLPEKLKDTGKGLIKGLTGKESPEALEALGYSKKDIEKLKEKMPLATKAAEFGAGVVLDPTTYIGGEGLIKLGKKAIPAIKGTKAVKAVEKTVNTEKEVSKLLDKEFIDNKFKDAKPLNKNNQTIGRPIESQLKSLQGKGDFSTGNSLLDSIRNDAGLSKNTLDAMLDLMNGTKREGKVTVSTPVKKEEIVPIVTKESSTINQIPNKIVKTSNSDLEALELKYKQDKELIKNNKVMYNEMKSKRLKALGMQYSAEKRKVIQRDSLESVEGGLTPKELANKKKQLNSNYVGKQIEVNGQEGVIVGNSFGKVGVKHADGTIKYYDNSLISQKKELATEASKEIVPVVTRDANNAPNLNKPANIIKESYPKTENVSNMYNTLKNSNILTDAEKAALNPEDFKYTRKTETESLDNASERISKDIDGEIEKLKNKEVYSGEDVDTAMGILTKHVKESRETGDTSKVREWMKTVRPAGATEAGRAVQAWSKYSRTPEGALMDLQSTVDKVHESLKTKNPKLINAADNEVNEISNLINEVKQSEFKGIKVNLQMFAEKLKKIKSINTYDELKKLMDKAKTPEKLKEMIYDKYGIPNIKDDDISFVTQSMEKAKDMDPSSYEYRRLISDVGIRINNKIPAEIDDSMKGLQRIMMLTSPKTIITRNPISNLLMGALEDLSYMFRVPIDAATSLVTKNRTAKFMPIKGTAESIKGVGQGFAEWGKDLRYGTNTAPTGGQAEFVKGRKAFNEKGVLKPVAWVGNKIDSFVGHALQLGDRPFFQAAYNKRIAELTKIHGEITDELAKQAYEWALERTFQNDSGLSKLFAKFKDPGLSKVSPLLDTSYKLLANLILPFSKTPANILDKFIEYSPLGTVKSGYELGKGIKTGTFNQAKFVNTLSRSMTGTGIAVAGFLMARNGLITPGADPNRKVETVEKSLGKQNYAFKTSNGYYSFDWALPTTGMLAAGADYWLAMKNSKEYQNAVKQGLSGSVNTLFNSTLLQGPSKLLSGYNPAQSIGKFLTGSVTQVTPAFGGQIAKMGDDYERETYSPGGNTLNTVKSRIPLVRNDLQRKVDVFGNDLKVDQSKIGIKKAFDIFLNPGNSTTFKPNETQKEILRLYDSGQTKQLPAIAEKVFDETKQHPRIELTSEEYYNYQKKLGELTMKGYNVNNVHIPGFEDIMNSPQYKLSKDEFKAKMLGNIIERSKKLAQKEILKGRGY